ncbi:hypothetical protein EGW08_020233 [Elysia chlorotica]|uniref:Uncharacterized protein n=1 Tax=Elysia chlorotica TaxID=188477 RepID=A0A433SRY2_ELYCH|nr:hypothetical protein EGW08_020233 [Elysia chlorotica]
MARASSATVDPLEDPIHSNPGLPMDDCDVLDKQFSYDVRNLQGEDCGGEGVGGKVCGGEDVVGKDFDIVGENSGGEEHHKHWERRLSCQETQKILDDLNQIMATSLHLPKNEGPVIECRLFKTLMSRGEDVEKTIDETIDSLKQWLEEQRNLLKEHVKSHHFRYSEDVTPLRMMDEKTRKKRIDSGICSQEVPPKQEDEWNTEHEMNSLKGEMWCARLTDPNEQARRGDDESSSVDCNICFCSYTECQCQGLTQDELRRDPVQKHRPKRLAIVSFSQLPQEKDQQEGGTKTSVVTQTDDPNTYSFTNPAFRHIGESKSAIPTLVAASTQTDPYAPFTRAVQPITYTVSNTVFTQTGCSKSPSTATQTDRRICCPLPNTVLTQIDEFESSMPCSNVACTQTDSHEELKQTEFNAVCTQTDSNAANTLTESNAACTQTYFNPAFAQTETNAANTLTESNAAQIDSNAAFTQTDSNAAFTQTDTNAAFTQTDSNAAFTQTDSNTAFTQTDSNAAFTQTDSNAALNTN